MKILTGKQTAELDKKAINEYGIPSIILMENAAIKFVNHLDPEDSYFVVVAGCGNNGGDGLAIARHLTNLGRDVDVFFAPGTGNISPETKINLDICVNMGINVLNIEEESDIWELREAVNDADCVLDALFGIGLTRKVTDLNKEIIDTINEMSNKVYSVDIPSGLHPDTGEVMGSAVKANKTITFTTFKTGFLNYNSSEYLGEIQVLDIGIPDKILFETGDSCYLVEDEMVRNLIPIRMRTGYKGDYGKALIVAGSTGYTGANKIASEACIKTGAGLVTVSSHKSVIKIIEENVREAMTIHPDNIEKAVASSDVIAFGPGMGNTEETSMLLFRIIKKLRSEGKSDAVLILDADGLNVFQGKTELLGNMGVKVIITPHFGEMARLTGKTIEYIKKNRMNVAFDFAKKNKLTVVLKGHNTIITDGESLYVNPTGSSAIASGGMGDCLTGMIAGLAGQGLSPLEAAIAATYLHGKIGDDLASSRYSVTASEIIERIPFELKNMVKS
ncbi:MAG: NAD(P)H-hydrate dehydratase [Clostridiaceae bacterium]